VYQSPALSLVIAFEKSFGKTICVSPPVSSLFTTNHHEPSASVPRSPARIRSGSIHASSRSARFDRTYRKASRVHERSISAALCVEQLRPSANAVYTVPTLVPTTTPYRVLLLVVEYVVT
jgi:hypothetical protein